MNDILRRVLERARVSAFPNAHDREMRRWHSEAGEARRYDYNLTADSVVMDVGGYDGQWASNLYSRYNCRIFIFEPVKAYAAETARRFQRNNKIEVQNVALGGSSRSAAISVERDGSSIFKTAGTQEVIEVLDVVEVFRRLQLDRVDLMKVNIEGGEYELLPRMCATGLITRVRDLQIQFHNIRSDSETRLLEIRRDLSKSHTAVYQYKFVWEGWSRF